MVDKVFVLETTSTGSGLLLVKAVVECGLEAVLVTDDSSKYRADINYEILREVDVIVMADYDEWIKHHSGSQRVLVVSGSDKHVVKAYEHTLALTGKDYGIPFIKAVRNKGALRSLLRDGSGSTVDWMVTSSSEELTEFVRKYRAVVLKPVQGTGSVGVRLCIGQDEVKKYFETCGGAVLCEQYLPGPLYSAEVFVAGQDFVISGFSDRQLGPLPNFVEIGASYPVDLTGVQNKVSDLLREVLEQSGPYFGALHVEFILTETGPKPVEINPRLGGGLIAEKLQLCHGVNPYLWHLQCILEEKLPEPETICAASQVALYAGKAGKLKELDFSLAKHAPGIQRVVPGKETGDQILHPHDYRGNIVNVLAKADTVNIAFNYAQSCVNSIRMVVQ